MAFYRGVYFLGNDSDLLKIEVVSLVFKIFSAGEGINV